MKTFTDRFIEMPVDLYNTEDAEMIGYNEETKVEPSYMKIIPFEIAYYRPAKDDDDNLTQTLIYLKTGENFHITLPIEEFEKRLNNFDK